MKELTSLALSALLDWNVLNSLKCSFENCGKEEKFKGN
jgi:hypothetical protein